MYLLIGFIVVIAVHVLAAISIKKVFKELLSPEMIGNEVSWFKSLVQRPWVNALRSWWLRFWASMKRHLISVVLFVVALFVMWLFTSIDDQTVKYLTEMVTAIAVRLSATILVLKFAFPKFELQERLKNEPIALAIFCGLIVVAVCK
jgi:hypothetical protein